MSAAPEGLNGLEWTEDGLSLRTSYDGDVDGDTGRHIVVGGEIIVTFSDSEEAEKYRNRVLIAMRPNWTYAIQYGPDGEDGYSWVYDECGQMIAVMRTHDAQRLAEPRA